MQLINLTALLGLAASVSAIDIALRNRANCDSRSGGYTCVNLNPNTCCAPATGVFPSLVIYAVPTDWYIEIRGHEGTRCGRVRTLDSLYRGTEKCLTNGPYTGAGYGFVSRKRSAVKPEVPRDSCATSATPCLSVKPDQLFLADGQKYNIVDMDSALLEELTALMENGSVKADIPDHFKPFEISA